MNTRNTFQKNAIKSVFLKLNHPSAGMVYEAVHAEYPGISRATVFRFCSDMAKSGKVQRLRLADTEDRFDITVRPHYHVVCRGCGGVADVDLPYAAEIQKSISDSCGYLIEGHTIEFTGLCPKCQKQNL